MWISDKLHIITTAKMPRIFLWILARMTHLSGLNHYSCHKPFTTVFCRLLASVFFWQGCRNIDATDLDACMPHPQAHRWESIKAARVQTYCNSQTHHTRQGVLVGRRWRNVIIKQTKTIWENLRMMWDTSLSSLHFFALQDSRILLFWGNLLFGCF